MSESRRDDISKPRRFIKFRIVIERIDGVPELRRSWEQEGVGGKYGYTPEIESEGRETTKVLEMEWREEIDIKRIVAAILG